MNRPLKVKVALVPKPEATNCPDALASAITAWLLGRTDNVPTIHIPKGAK